MKTSGTFGILWKKLRPKWKERNYYLELLALGIIVHATMSLCTFFLPPNIALATLKAIALPLLLIYSPGTMLLGLLMLRQFSNWQNRTVREDLYETERRYNQLLKNMNIISVVLDLKGNITFCNDYLLRITDYKENEIMGKNWFDIFIDKIDRPKVKEVYDKIIKGKELIEYYDNTILTKNSEKRFILWHNNLLKSAKGEIIGLASIGVDITEQKKIEIELIEKNKILNEAQQIAHIGHWELDIQKNKILWSDETYKIFGLQAQEIEATYESLLNYIHPDDRETVKEAYKNSLIEKKPYKIEHRLRLKTGEIKHIMEKCHTEFDGNGKALRSIGTILDITNRKRMELDFIKAKEKAEESDQLKSEFLNNMSHEIRTPLNAIMGFSDLLNNPNLSYEKREEYISIILNSGKQLLKIIDAILEISRLETKQEKITENKVCLNDLLLELFLNHKSKIEKNNLSLVLDKESPLNKIIIITDALKLENILHHLIDNALKFTHEGFITLGYRIKNDTDPSLLEIVVQDTGIGIKEDKQQIIFERFSQEEKGLSRKTGGLGLGLCIAKKNAELLGGNITVVSEKGKGSTFFVSIPYRPIPTEELSMRVKNV